MRIVYSVFLIMGLIIPAIASETTFLCETDRAAMLGKKKWVSDSFPYRNFTVKFNDDYSELKGLRERVDVSPNLLCKETHQIGTVRCVDLFNWEKFTFDTKDLRFVYMMSSWFGHLSEEKSDGGDDIGGWDDFIITGQCKKGD